mmetsp:Transcript_49544/g.97558  ORF Transcript_49544/g.97558 Transcript_49544/m.97558 type:complete len:92 (+) Transcript_49544:1475-1750(+)
MSMVVWNFSFDLLISSPSLFPPSPIFTSLREAALPACMAVDGHYSEDLRLSSHLDRESIRPSCRGPACLPQKKQRRRGETETRDGSVCMND